VAPSGWNSVATWPKGVSLPRAGLIAMTRKRVAIGLHVLIRPRAGDFCYSADEFEVMKRDVLLANWVPIGVVFGILDADANVDGERSRQLVALAPPLAVPFHRAFDRVRDPAPALEGVVKTGADRILTSGGAPERRRSRRPAWCTWSAPQPGGS